MPSIDSELPHSADIPPGKHSGSRAMRFIGIVLTLTLALISAQVGFVWTYDPYNSLIWERNYQAILADPRSTGGFFGWLTKASLVNRASSDAIVIGSSKLMYVDPKDLKYFNFINASVGAASIEYMREFLDVTAHDVDVVVLGLDFFMINEARFPIVADAELARFRIAAEFVRDRPDELGPRLNATHAVWTGRYAQLLSGRKTMDTLSKLGGSSCTGPGSPNSILEDGNLNVGHWAKDTEDRNARGLGFDEALYRRQLEHLRTEHYRPFVYSTRRIGLLNDIKTILANRGIRLVVVLNPVNTKDLELIKSMKVDEYLIRFKEDVARVLPDATDFSISDYSETRNFIYWDPIHFLPMTGSAIINGLLDNFVSPTRIKMQAIREETAKLKTEYFQPEKKNIISSVNDDPVRGERAFDGNENTWWKSVERGPKIKGNAWIGIEYAQPQKISKIRLNQGPPASLNRQNMVHVQQSMDGGKNWTGVGTQAFCTNDKVSEIRLPYAPRANQWRILAAATAQSPHHWEVIEVEMLSSEP